MDRGHNRQAGLPSPRCFWTTEGAPVRCLPPGRSWSSGQRLPSGDAPGQWTTSPTRQVQEELLGDVSRQAGRQDDVYLQKVLLDNVSRQAGRQDLCNQSTKKDIRCQTPLDKHIYFIHYLFNFVL